MMMMMAMIMAMILKIWIVWNTVCMQLLPSPLIRSGHFHICIRSFCGNTFTFSIWYISQSLPHPTKENLIVKLTPFSLYFFSTASVHICRHQTSLLDTRQMHSESLAVARPHAQMSFFNISTTFWYVPWLMQRNWCLRTVSCFGQDEKGLKFSSEPTSRWRRMFKWSEEAGRHNPPI